MVGFYLKIALILFKFKGFLDRIATVFIHEKETTMQLKLAREDLNSNPKSITVEKLLEEVAAKRPCIYYFDKSNSHKDLIALVEKVEKLSASIYLREVKYGLDEQDYMYDVHII